MKTKNYKLKDKKFKTGAPILLSFSSNLLSFNCYLLTFFSFYLLTFSLKAQTPSTTENYILSVELLEPMTSVPTDLNGIPETHKKVSIVYFDDLGREKQSILYKGTPDGKDIVTKYEYDGFGRQLKEYLSAPTTQTSGAFITDPTAAYTAHYGAAPYMTDVYFSEKELESSPLSRVMKQAAPGDDWELGSGHEIKFQFYSNSAIEVDLYWVDTSGNLRKGGYPILGDKYPAKSLYRTITTDENGHTTYEYKDKQGRVVLTRSLVETDNIAGRTDPDPVVTENVDTYYVYDDYGNLRYVVPPKAAAVIPVGTVSSTVISGLCYTYKYDTRNRMTERQIPGKDWEYMVYDKQNRLVATQDGEMRKTTFTFPSGMTGKAWAFTKYDKFGRVVYTGLYKSNDSRATLQNLLDTYNGNNEILNSSFSQNGITVYHTRANAFPKNHTASDSDLLTVNYYDKYIPAMLTADGVTVPSSVEGQDVRNGDNSENESLKGLPVASHLRVLPDQGWERTYTFYDEKSRPVYTHKVNHLDGMTTVKSKLKFRGMPEYSKTYHKRDAATLEVETKDNFTYDNMERPLRHTQNLNNSSTQNLIALNQYDKLGQLLNKKVGGTDVTGTNRWQQVDYKYNIRGWLTDINSVGVTLMGKDAVPPTPTDDLFSFKINYNFLVNNGGDYAEPLYNGNIAQTLWKTATDNKLRGYVYEYDRLNRMTDAIYYKQDVNPYIGNYNEHVAYDLNGNITSLSRYGGYENQSLPDEMDILSYTYATRSNQLIKVVDDGQDNTGFIDSATNTTNDYTYDSNGNMITDKNKNITSIKYNHLNLPTLISFGNGTSITYLYNAAGQKLNKLVNSVPIDNMIKSVDYLDGFQYTGGELNFFPHPEGYVNVTLGTTGNRIFNYVYYYTDHLGNIRLTYTKDMVSNQLKIMDENHYYPFGLKHQKYTSPGSLDLKAESEDIARPGYATSTPFMYKYNGKEFQDELGLGLYDYGWRNYDPAIARWVVPDPLLNDLKTTIDFDQLDEDADEIDMSIAFSNKMEVGGGVYNPDNLNPFSYGYNNPVSFDDPDGRCPMCIVGIFLLVGGGVASAPTNDRAGDVEKVQKAINLQRDILLATATGGAGTARGTVTTVVGATAKNAGNANKTQAAQKGAQKTQQAKNIIDSKKIDGPNSKYENSTNPSKNNSKPTTPNRTTDVSKQEFEKNVQKSGFEKTSTSKDGKSTTYSNGKKSYVTRDSSKSSGPTADMKKNSAGTGDSALKIRLGENQFEPKF